jgi:VWFA-related protein
MRLLKPLMLILFILLLDAFTFAFQANPPQGQAEAQRQGPPGTIRVRVGLVPVDVIVTDDNNRPVTDLKKEDFQVFENGRLQDIRHFSVQTFTPAAAEPAKPGTIRLVPTLELAPQSARTFLILLGRGRHNQALKAVDQLIRFVKEDLLPQDKVAVYAYGRATDFTTDHAQIAKVLEQYNKVSEKLESWFELNLKGFRIVYGAREIPKSLQSSVAAIFDGASGLASRQVPPGQVTNEGRIIQEWDRATGIILGNLDRAGETGMRLLSAADQAASGMTIAAPTMQSLMSFDQLEAEAITLGLPFDEFIPRAGDSIGDLQNIFTCIEYLRYVEGEKHLLFFSGGGMLFPYGNMEYDKGIATVANDARVAIDTFHTGGLSPTVMPTQGTTLASTPRGSGATSAPPPPVGSLFSWGDTAGGQSLRTISALTGGHTSIYQDIGKSLDIVDQSTRVEYLLGYYPKDEIWNGRYRQINVKVNRPGVKVLFRRGYFARDHLQPYDKAEFLAYSRISAAMMYPDNIEDVPFKLSASKGADAAGQRTVKLDLKIGIAKLEFKNSENLRTDRLRIAAYYQDAGQHPLGNVWQNLDLKLQEATYQGYLKSGIPFSIEIPAVLKDMIIKVVVYDMQGDRIGSRHIRVEKFWQP